MDVQVPREKDYKGGPYLRIMVLMFPRFVSQETSCHSLNVALNCSAAPNGVP